MDKKRTVTDTSTRDQVELLALDALGEALGGGRGAAAVERQEARGQHEAVNSTQLPAKGLIGAERPVWEALGLKIVNTSGKDSLFVEVELPKGWTKRSTDHYLWNEIVDDKGRVRGMFFYKAASYDRDAFMQSPPQRYTVRVDSSGPRDEWKRTFRYQVLDGGKKVLFSTEAEKLEYEQFDREKYDANEVTEKRLRAECEAWLVANGFPNWKDATAYWDWCRRRSAQPAGTGRRRSQPRRNRRRL